MTAGKAGALALGLDTGGTHTDAVLLAPDGRVIASAKALTTPHDLALGAAAALDAAVGARGGEIALVSISTTLATNAIVEGQGSEAALALIGHPPGDGRRADLARALGGAPLIAVAGGHDASGDPRAPLDEAALSRRARAVKDRVSAFAVSSMFAVRNPEHEILARDLLHAETGLPVSCGHELSSRLDAPRRALTCLLNARLLSLVRELVAAVDRLIAARGIAAPVMMVKGDGSLIDAASAMRSPVETLLSGPAASAVGALHLAALDHAFVCDIGGTTTDVALVRDGRPLIDPEGAVVGGYRTMVRAVAAHSFGLGGDSEIRLDERGGLRAGPRRVVPLCLLAHRFPAVRAALEAQAERSRPGERDAAFALRRRSRDSEPASLTPRERRLWEELAAGPRSLERLHEDRSPGPALARLLDRGLVVLAGMTPTDAAHLLGLHRDWDRDAAALGARLWLRRWRASGHDAPDSVEDFARHVFEAVVTGSARVLLDTAVMAEHGVALSAGPGGEAVVRATIDGGDGDLVRLRARLGREIVAVGAAAAAYYPEIARRLGTGVSVPDHAQVCNAVGAAASGIARRVDAVITSPVEGVFRCHLPDGIADFRELAAAARHAEARLRRCAGEAAAGMGAVDIRIDIERQDDIAAGPGGARTFVETRLSALASGRPAALAGRGRLDSDASGDHMDTGPYRS